MRLIIRVRLLAILVCACAALFVAPALAFADNVTNSVGASATVPIPAKTSVAVSFRLLQRNKDGVKGCNASGSAPAILTIEAPDAVTVVPAGKQLTFRNCRNSQTAVFSVEGQGGPYPITVIMTGQGTFDTSAASFILLGLPPLDDEAPLVTVHVPAPNSAGWYVSKPVVGTVTAADSSNVIAISCTGADIANVSGLGSTVASADLVVPADGATYVSCQAADGAVPSHTGVSRGSVYSAYVQIDTVPPMVTPAWDRDPDANGWYNHSVTVSFQGEDDSSGIDACDPPVPYSGPDQAGAIVWGSCSDLAGNVAPRQAAVFDYDATPPSQVAGSPDRQPDFHGGYRRSVVIAFAGVDAVSGADPASLSCTSASYTGPASPHAVVAGACTDPAGNTSPSAAYNFEFFGMNLLPLLRR